MTTLAQELTREHQDIDAAIAAFGQAADGQSETEAMRAAMRAALRTALATLRRHIWLEETMLFPPMRAGSAFAAIFAMLREHGQMWPILDRIERALEGGGAGPEITAALAELAQVLAAHNDKEERTIYSLADAAHAGESAQKLLALLADGEMPAGWRCARAEPAAGNGD